VPATARPDEILNLTIPLSNASADLVAKQIQPLIADYGSVVSVPAQNMVIIVETAAQCRRIQEIVQAIDQVRPVDSAVPALSAQVRQSRGVQQRAQGFAGRAQRARFSSTRTASRRWCRM